MSFSLIVILTINSCLIAQDEDDIDVNHIESSLVNFSNINSNIEFYNFNSAQQSVQWVTNGTIEFGSSDYLNVEVIGTRHDTNGNSAIVLGDFSLAYTKNFYSGNYHDPGFQGWSPTLKFVIPTGNPNYPAIFGHWILEPSVKISWLLQDERFYVSARLRYNFPVSKSNTWPEPPILLRFEPQVGFENLKFWTSIGLDNRMVFNQDEFVMFGRLDAGYKISDKTGVSAFYIENIYNLALFKTYAGIGGYLIL
jgi:hypothetical protein